MICNKNCALCNFYASFIQILCNFIVKYHNKLINSQNVAFNATKNTGERQMEKSPVFTLNITI